MMEFLDVNTKQKIRVDPRSKLLILLMISIFVFSGAGGNQWVMNFVRPILTAIPLVFLIFEGKVKSVLLCVTFYGIFYFLEIAVLGMTKGLLNYILLFSIGFFVRILPNLMAAYYLISTTTVSELVCAMQRMRFSDKLIIPLIVMIRFSPVAIEEASAVSDAMRMRGIRFGGKNIAKIIGYRFIPMITCSVKVGEELSASALARGLGSPVKRTNICNIGFQGIDFFIFSLALLTIGAFISTLF